MYLLAWLNEAAAYKVCLPHQERTLRVKFERDRKNVGGRAFRGAVLLTGGRALTRAFSLLNLVVLARLLSPEDYGVVALAFTVLALLQAIFETGAGSALVVKKNISSAHLDTAFTIQVVRGLLLGLIVFAGAAPMAQLLGVRELTPVFRVLALMLVFDGFANPGLHIFGRNLDFSREVVRDVGAAALSSLLAITIALWLENYWALVIGAVTARFVQMVLTHWRIPYRPRFGLTDWRSFASFGSWIAVENIVSQLNTVAPRLLVWNFMSTAALGLFTIGRELQSIPLNEMLAPIRRSLLPGFAAYADDDEALRNAFRISQAVIFGFALPIGFGMSLLAQQLIAILVGKQWLGAAVILQIVGPAMALKTIVGPVANLAMVREALRTMFVRTLMITIITFPVLAAGIWLGGLTGLAIGLAILALVRVIANVLLAKQLLGEPIYRTFLTGARSFLASGVMTAAVLALPFDFDPERSTLHIILTTLPQLLVGAAAYFCTHFGVWAATGRPDGFERVSIRYAGKAWRAWQRFVSKHRLRFRRSC